jgi:hypothetical protein
MALITCCPRCQCRDVGRIGTHQYYCWGCCAELVVDNTEVHLYEVAEDGSLLDLGRMEIVG